MTARFLMIGLDGADGALLDRWSADGTLPNLAALRASGSLTRLSAPKGITDDGLWASFQYAAGLGEHGRYHWLQPLRSGQMGMAYLNEANRESFWHALSDQGLRVAVFDVPKCGPPGTLNGIHLTDWLVHGRYFREPKSHPATLAAEVVERFGPAPPSRCSYEEPCLDDEDVREVAANLRISVARKRAAGLHYLSSGPWDLFVMAFKEAHCAGHHLWDLADPRHAGFDAARTARLGDPYRAILLDLDAAVGELVAAAGPEAAVAVFATTEMVPAATLDSLMPEIVDRLNRSLGETALRRMLRRRRLCEILPYNDNCTALRLDPRWTNLRWRPAGVGKNSRMLEQIEFLLGELTDAETGQPVIAAIDRPSTTHVGTRAAALPDLLIQYAAGTYPGAVVSPRLGRIEAARPPIRPGNHSSGGVLILAGASASEVSAMQDLGPLAATVLCGGKLGRDGYFSPSTTKRSESSRAKQ